MEHFIERLGRTAQQGDWLTTREARVVLIANSNKSVNLEYVLYIAKREKVHIQDIEGKFFYLYEDLKDLKVNLRRGPSRSPSASPSAIRQRAWRARQKEKKSC
ncbi:MAG: hypothetical protein ACRDHZ_07775 [Ktedonobacteraceae bacterium]